eukprot:jgi/Tetstr1/443067/TSEL_031125.t1
MANSRFEYVRDYELDDALLPGCWIVLRLDGRGFTKFSTAHDFQKPNDERALNLMNACATAVMDEFTDMRLAYGESDEYSFALHKASKLYGRRASKLVSLVTSYFTANYVMLWPRFFSTPLQSAPMFDGRAVCYPTDDALRDYFAWRQADTHINNQYNTCFWALVKAGSAPADAQRTLKGTQTKEKNELLFERFGINYNTLPDMFKKGSVIVRQKREVPSGKTRDDGTPVTRLRSIAAVLHVDLIAPGFWEEHPQVLKDTLRA